MKVISSYLASDVHIQGKITCNGPARIDGTCHGIIEGRHEITIGTSAHIHGKINSKSIIVNGQIEGDLAADKTITLLSDGEVTGKFYAPSGGISIYKGGKLEGSFHLGTPPDFIPK